MENILKYIIYISLGALLFLPLFVAESLYFPFITGKGFAFRAIVEVVLALWLILAIKYPAYRPRNSIMLASLALFVVVMGMAVVFSENPFKSFWSNFERMEGYVLLLHLFAYFIVLGSMLRTQKLWNVFFNTTLFASFLVSGFGIVQLLGGAEINQGGVRVDATFGNAAYLAGYLLFHVFLAVFMHVRANAAWVRWCYRVLIALHIVIIFFTATRGAAIGLIVGTMVALGLAAFSSTISTRARKGARGALFLLLALGALFFLVRSTPMVTEHPILSRFSSLVTLDQLKKEATPRFAVWNMALEGARERPLTGWGQESFNYVFNKYYDPVMHDQEQWFDRVHNIFLDWLIAGGIFGLLFYLALFECALLSVWRERFLPLGHRMKERFACFFAHDECYHFRASEQIAMTGLFAAYFAQNFFVFDNLFTYVPFFSMLAYVHASTAHEGRSLLHMNAPAPVANWIAPTVIVVLFALTLNAVVVQPVRANQTLILAISSSGTPSERLDYFQEALAFNTLGKQETREQLMQFALQFNNEDVPAELRSRAYKEAVDALNEQIAEAPNDARPVLFLGTFLNSIGEHDEAIRVLKRAHELSPRKQTILMSIGAAYMNKREFTAALPYLHDAFVLEKRNRQAGTLLAGTLIVTGARDEAIGVLQEMIVADPTFKEQGTYYISEIQAGRNP